MKGITGLHPAVEKTAVVAIATWFGGHTVGHTAGALYDKLTGNG